ncbi:30S ribosomal protein S4 [Leptospira koniambonensis]|uniref:Small ribosomal subunit protein uS4 n=1 Tax=Leptospira koniambonensis TaxID=2484950 RepID=A0A4R9J9V6_9LEPT|nr:30S ribosomal protein S4 [Leptospira koniambonensis]TGL35028.1 30S ribosomal protein S4 [Leptospira koniambonensis]
MARYRGPVVKLMRREGVNLYLKSSFTFNRDKFHKKGPPGMQPKRKPKISEYGSQLREKQKLKRAYGLLEKQFRSLYEEASHSHGVTGEILLQLLERRLDNAVYRLGFAVTRRQARNFIAHNHILVNGEKVDIPSFRLKVGDKIEIKPKFRTSGFITQNIQLAQSLNNIPSWVSSDFIQFSGEILSLPERHHIDIPVKEQVIVELYSK